MLVTAREMLQDGGERWLLPTCNGALRIQKPPLPYWLAALSYKVTGQIDEWSGRLPSVLYAWLTLGVVYFAGARLISQRGGVLAAGMLLSSYLFFRHGRLAETDIPTVFYVSLAIVGCWRGMELYRAKQSSAVWFLVAGLGCGGAFMSKGVPGAYGILFALIYAMVTRNWRGLRQYALLALPLMLVVSLPWYLLILHAGKWQVLLNELRVVAEGDDHPGSIVDIVHQLFLATAPWCAFWAIGLVRGVTYLWGWMSGSVKIKQRREEWSPGRRPTLILCWILATLLPILLSENKQFHYTMPLMPAVMLFSAWVLETSGNEPAEGKYHRVVYRFTGITLGLLLAGGVIILGWGGLMWRGFLQRGEETFALWSIVLGVGLVVAGGFALLVWRKGNAWAGVFAACGVLAAVFPWLVGPWSDALQKADIVDVADTIRAHAGAGPMVAYQSYQSLPLAFQLQQVIPLLKPDELPAFAKMDATILVEAKPDAADVMLPDPWHMAWRGGIKGQYFLLYRAGK